MRYSVLFRRGRGPRNTRSTAPSSDHLPNWSNPTELVSVCRRHVVNARQLLVLVLPMRHDSAAYGMKSDVTRPVTQYNLPNDRRLKRARRRGSRSSVSRTAAGSMKRLQSSDLGWRTTAGGRLHRQTQMRGKSRSVGRLENGRKYYRARPTGGSAGLASERWLYAIIFKAPSRRIVRRSADI